MDNDSAKEQRRQKADFERALKKAREVNSLSITFLRSASILMVLGARIKAWKESGKEFRTEFGRALANIEANESSQMASLIFFFYASLYVVIEGWRDKKQSPPPLQDAVIDELLLSPYVNTLADFRNSILHPNSMFDKRLLAFMSDHPKLLPWAMRLSDEFLRYFRDWRQSLRSSVARSI